MTPLFEMPELLTLSGEAYSTAVAGTSQGGGCSPGCTSGCCGGCGGGSGDGKPLKTRFAVDDPIGTATAL